MEPPVYMVLFISILRMQVSRALFSCPQSAPTITFVNSCPQNKTEWDRAAERKKCNLMAAYQNCTDTARFQYHCLLNHHRNATLEVCAPVFYLQGFCASYNTERIDIVENYEPGFECLSFSGADRCPDRYPSSDAYKCIVSCYLRCYVFKNDIKSTTTTAAVTPTEPVPVSMPWENDRMDSTYIAIIVTLSIAFLAVTLFSIILRYRTEFCSKGISEIRQQKTRKETSEADVDNLEEKNIQEGKPLLKNDVDNLEEKNIEEEKPLLKHDKIIEDAVEPSEAETKQNDMKEQEQELKKDAPTVAASNSQINSDGEKEKIIKLKELLKYPVLILKHEVDVKVLKEKILIYSKSIKAHFTAPLMSGLHDVQSLDDFHKLDMSLIFTLLQNFCENIKPPMKGWGYKPRSDETTIGADIERIRLMWNRFCDDDDLEFHQLDDVYNRIRQKYATVGLLGDDCARESPSKEKEGFEGLKDKIPSITLRPDCYNEEGIIITDNIALARKLVQEKNVVILKGVIGCGKTYALKAIQNHFNVNNWNTAWVQEEELLHLPNFPAKTILICDNLFGRLGCHAFSKSDIQGIEKSFESIANDQSDIIKVVTGIHQHVFEEVKKTYPLNFLQNKNLSIDMDKLSDAETLMIFKEQQKEGHCKADSGCGFGKIAFSSVLSKLSKSPGQVGTPFLSLMYCYFHDLFSEDDFTKNPVQTLMRRLNTMMKNSHKDYACLVYLMCVQNQELDKDLEPLAGLIHEEISIDVIDNLNKQKPGYIHIEHKNAILIHDIMTIAVFKSAAEVKEDFLFVVKNCRVDILSELMRPSVDSHCEFYTSLVNTRKRQEFRDVGKKLVYRFAQTFGKDCEHPLQSEELFREKYKRYLVIRPKILENC